MNPSLSLICCNLNESRTIVCVSCSGGKSTDCTFITLSDNAQSDKDCLHVSVWCSLSFRDIVALHCMLQHPAAFYCAVVFVCSHCK